MEAKINELQQQTDFYLTELRTVFDKINAKKTGRVLSYFTSSLNMSYADDEESLCLCSYHIWNIGNVPLTNPTITIKLAEDSPFTFSGRYIHSIFQRNLRQTNQNEWVRINNDGHKNTFSFKPLEKTVIKPNEILSFEQFQIRWLNNTPCGESITGITYCDQFQDGIAAINPINLSVITQDQEE